MQFTPLKDSSSIIITFKSLKDRVEFMDSIYSDNEMKQIGGGMRLENLSKLENIENYRWIDRNWFSWLWLV